MGASTTYTVTVTNAGPGTEGAHLRLAGGKGAVDTSTGDPVKSLSRDHHAGSLQERRLRRHLPARRSWRPVRRPPSRVVVEPLERDVPNLDLQATFEPVKESVGRLQRRRTTTSSSTPRSRSRSRSRGCRTAAPRRRSCSESGPGSARPAKQTKVEVDNKVLGSSTQEPPEGHDQAGRALEPGKHNLTVTVQSAGPPLATLKDKFKTCEA